MCVRLDRSRNRKRDSLAEISALVCVPASPGELRHESLCAIRSPKKRTGEVDYGARNAHFRRSVRDPLRAIVKRANDKTILRFDKYNRCREIQISRASAPAKITERRENPLARRRAGAIEKLEIGRRGQDKHLQGRACATELTEIWKYADMNAECGISRADKIASREFEWRRSGRASGADDSACEVTRERAKTA